VGNGSGGNGREARDGVHTAWTVGLSATDPTGGPAEIIVPVRPEAAIAPRFDALNGNFAGGTATRRAP
jgi:hypothetical protein